VLALGCERRAGLHVQLACAVRHFGAFRAVELGEQRRVLETPGSIRDCSMGCSAILSARLEPRVERM
jgi:hypothetical protein